MPKGNTIAKQPIIEGNNDCIDVVDKEEKNVIENIPSSSELQEGRDDIFRKGKSSNKHKVRKVSWAEKMRLAEECFDQANQEMLDFLDCQPKHLSNR